MKGRDFIAKKNIGKVFETNIKNSCPDWLLEYKPPDAAQSFDMSSKLRFSQRSPADYFLFNGYTGIFYTLECKSFAGSCSFERTEEDEGIIHLHQRESLKKFAKYPRVISGFLLDFRKTDKTYFLHINDFEKMITYIDKKSFNEKDVFRWCSPILINKKKLKVNYRYDIEGFLNDSKILV